MATPAIGLRPCAIQVNLFTGGRTPLPAGTEALLTLRDGSQNEVPLPNNGFFSVPTINIEGLRFFDNFGDNYTVVASADGYSQAGFTPVTVNPRSPGIVDIMLLGKDATYSFRDARWDSLKLNYKEYASLLAAGADDAQAAQDRYTQLMETQPAVLACFFNLATAMSQIHLPDGTPLDYIHELIWDDSQQQGMKPDRFFAWADRKLIDQIIRAEAQKQFAPEPGTAVFHPGATRSWKQVQFGEANVQLTFHEKQANTIDGADCVVVEPDIDYYKDPLAHAIFEVITNAVTHSLTDPRQVYMLRWIAGRRAGVPNFEPPYVLE
jgi:hypothetical protein